MNKKGIKIPGKYKQPEDNMRFSKEEKAMRLEDWRLSGKSAWAYAKANGIFPQTFINWTKKKPEPKSCFVEVPAKIIQPLQAAHEIVIEKGDMKIHIPLPVGHNELRAVFAALRDSV
jgi:hypothetical protein